MTITTEAVSQEQPQTVRGALKVLSDVLNGPAHERSLNLYMVIVLMHWLEHVVQAYQVFWLGWARPDSLGVVGLWLPWLVKTELMHWAYAFFMLIGLIILLPGFAGRSRKWWIASLAIQSWHFVEHSILQAQTMVGTNLFGSAVPSSIFQIWIPRVELHLLYNAAVFIPMVVAMYYHMYPPKHETPAIACTCARRSPHHNKKRKAA